MDFIVDAGGNGLPMMEMWAWVTVHGENDHSITTFNGLPLVGQKEATVRKFAPLLRSTVKPSGKPQRLVRFDRVTVIEQIDP